MRGHARWVRISHGILTASVLTLAVSGFVILMAHPRLYWGNAGNDLTPPLVELPISRNFHHGGWTERAPFFSDATGPASASRTYEIFNENGWARSLHFLAAWWLALPGVVYLAIGWSNGYFRAHVVPASGASKYSRAQRLAYSLVIFVAAPLLVATGLTMSPAVTAAAPVLLTLFGGYQSARTIHFATFVALVLFVVGHVAMVYLSGFRRQVRAITVGD